MRLFGYRWLLQYAHGVSVLSFSINRFLNELHLGKLSETAAHNPRPREAQGRDFLPAKSLKLRRASKK